MKILLILCGIAVISAEEVKHEERICEGVEVRGKFHRSEILAKGLNRPYQLSYYKHKHEIFFSNNIGDDDEDKFEIRWLEKGEPESKAIEEIRNGFATAIDQENLVAYFGGSEGIYMHDLEARGEFVQSIDDHNIWDLFFKHHLYFISYPSQRLYKYEHSVKPKHNEDKKIKKHKNKEKATRIKPEHQKWVHEKIFQFAIDGDDDIFITNETGLFMIKNGTENRTLIHGERVFRAIEINNKGEAHFSGQHGIYVPHKHNHTLHQIAHIKNIFGLTFDVDDNIIYSNPHQIVKLLPEECKDEGMYVPVPI